MKQQVQTFGFHGTPIRAFINEQGDPWFLAKDVCDVLGTATKDVRRILETDEVSNIDEIDNGDISTFWGLDTSNGGRSPLIVNEYGLYRLIMRSSKPEARNFQRWVTHDVLPSLRRTGAYMTPDTLLRATQDPDFIIGLLTNLKQEQTERRRLADVNRELEPKAQAFDDFTSTSGSFSVAEAAQQLSNAGAGPIGRDRLFQFMNELGWLYRRDGAWTAKQNRVDAGHLVMKSHRSHGTHHDGSSFAFASTVRVTRKGLALLHRKWCERRFAQTLDASIQPTFDQEGNQ